MNNNYLLIERRLIGMTTQQRSALRSSITKTVVDPMNVFLPYCSFSFLATRTTIGLNVARTVKRTSDKTAMICLPSLLD